MNKINASIVGAAGYTGGELVRLLVNHSKVNLVAAVSQSQQGKSLSDFFPDLNGETNLLFTSEVANNSDVVFLCSQHGESQKYLKQNPHILKSKVIDLSRDFRLNGHNSLNGASFIYGLPELNRDLIKKASYVANPGCFATCIQLALLPLANEHLLTDDIVVTAITGSTGAGQKPSDTTHLSWRQNNVSAYSVFEHPHNAEVLQSVRQLQSDFRNEFLFVPQRGPFTRGIMATTVVASGLSEEEAKKKYSEFYKGHPFAIVSDKDINMKMAVNTNKCFLYLKKHNKHLLIISILDNLLKGASGQAVQNMNLMFGLDEMEGLRLKASTY